MSKRIRQRVCVYVTKDKQLLVFDHQDDGLVAGLQTIGGGIKSHESPEQAAVREALEEAGLTLHNPVLLGQALIDIPEVLHSRNAYRQWQQYYVWCTAEQAPNAWNFRVQGSGNDAGELYRYKFVPMNDVVLSSGQDAFLQQLSKLLA